MTAVWTLQATRRDQGLIGKGQPGGRLLPTKGQSREMGLSHTQQRQNSVRRLRDRGGRGGNKRTVCSRRWGLQNFLSERHKTDVMRSLKP